MVTNGLTSTRYTPLESLLFFQALRSQDLKAINFEKISNDLLTLPLVANDGTFDRGRLSADALQHLYLTLVKEEAREELSRASIDVAPVQAGDLSPGSRKRKAASPSLPTVEAAAKHVHLLPRLLTKLYARYRETVVAAIKEEEQNIDRLDQEIKQVENGELDEKLRFDNGIAAAQSVPDGLPQKTDDVVKPQDTSPLRPVTSGTQGSDHSHSDGRPRSARASIDALVNHTPEADNAKARHSRQPSGPPAPASRGPLPPLSEMAPEHLTGPGTPQQIRPSPGQSVAQQYGQPQGGYQASPPVKHPSPYLQQYPMAAPSPPTQHPLPNQSPTSPERMLPVTAGMKAHGSPNMQNGFQPPVPPGQLPMQPPPYGSPLQQRPSPVQGPPAGRGYPPPPPPPPPPQYQYQQYQQYPSPQPQPPYLQHHQAQQATQYQIRPSQAGGFQLPPFQVSAQDPSKVRHQYPNQRGTPQPPRYPQQPPPPPPAQQSPYAPYQQYPQTPQNQPRLSLDMQRMTNSVVASLRRPRSLSTWRLQNRPPLQRPQSPPRPEAEPLSPTRPLAQPTKDTEPPSSPPPQPVDDTKQRKGSKKHTRKNRGSSVASSNIASSTRGRTRSQSVVSHPESSAADRPSTRSRGGAKADRSTPAEPPSDPAETPATRTTRTRRSTLQPPSSTVRPSPRGTPLPTYPDHREERRDVVYATRNFSRLSSVILNEISAHRHAGPFQKPVNERDVEGYNDIIKRPQDLKSIKAAITAGSRAVTAAIAAKEAEPENVEEDAGQSTGSTIMLAKTEDLIPPKGIVNSAQLEKEVMRMFANAVMFNPGGEGFVVDAREMADDVARKVGDWRGVETHEDGQGSGKRRKL
ncbi:Bromodomain-containing protein 8 [Sphaceloma murrayae]|uniref:Bromodomain-containing protein 8 n=1 Tax=Sphaceloma murrayae TaxID=2082308 RepID=A0A2K1QPH5_9PEZI|nr:Bromodomain-containing protein 8 [Sphaceloma murrayae]